MKKIFSLFVVIGLSIHVVAQHVQWTETYPGIWKGLIGKPESYNLLNASGAVANSAALKQLSPAAFPLSKKDIDIRMVDGKTYLRFPLQKEEQLYGFGLNFKSVQQRGRIMELHVDHYGGEDNGRTHAPTPFYVSSNGYGVFINSARYLKVWAGTGVRKDSPEFPEPRDRNTDKQWSASPYSDAVEILVPAAGAEVYVFAGPQPIDVVKRYNLLNGGGCLPPRWGLGFVQRVKTMFNADEVQEEARLFEEKGYPLDMIGLEPGWQSKSYPGSFSWDESRFPNPSSFVHDMLNKGIRLNLWINPYVSPHAPFYKEMKPFTSSHTVWLGQIPDFNVPKARTLFFDQLKKNQVDLGVSGYKIDEVDGFDHWLWPDVASFPSGVSAEQMRQTYGVLAMRYSMDMFRKLNKRTFGLVRASNGGAASMPYVIYNDYYEHRDFITALANSGFAGVLWTPEVRSSDSAEEWLRRFQSNVFSPMAMINAWTDGTKPWSFPEVEKDIKAYAMLRMQMMPYWYSEFAKYHFEGIPPFRAMYLEEGFLESSGLKSEVKNVKGPSKPSNVKDQYMAGEYILVAPMFKGETSRKVILPTGKWYDFYTGEYAGDGETITVTPGLSKIPVYVKDGGIIPMMKPVLHSPKPDQKTDLEIRYYGSKASSYMLYDDDGISFDYEKGNYSWRKINVGKNADGTFTSSIEKPVKGKPSTYGEIRFNFMTKK